MGFKMTMMNGTLWLTVSWLLYLMMLSAGIDETGEDTTRLLSYSVLDGTHVKEGNTEYVVQKPPGLVKGLVFLAHGCSHSSTDWWPKSENCEECIGLPVERTLVAKVLSEGYVALALSSDDRKRRCWHPQKDTNKAIDVIKNVRYKMGVPKSAPNLLIGASSGGVFVGHLGVHLNMAATKENDISLGCRGLSIQISPFQTKFCRDPHFLPYLPRLISFVHMSRDDMVTSAIRDAQKCIADGVTAFNTRKPSALDNVSTKVDEVRTSVILAKPKALVPNYFHQSGNHLTPAESAAYVTALERDGFIDPETKLLIKDPRQYTKELVELAQVTIPSISEKDRLIHDESGITELLNVAFAQHEITDEGLDEVFAMFAMFRG